MPEFHIAQVNIARAKVPLSDSSLNDFFPYLAPINALAEASPGFVWRFQTESGDATGMRAYDDDQIIINFTVWESVESLKEFVYKHGHASVMRKRNRWFEKMEQSNMAMWWVPVGHIPTWAEAQARLDALRQQGETAFAFTFRTLFPPPQA